MISIISNVYQNSLSFKGLQAAAQTTPANIEKLAEEKQKKATILSILYNSIIGKNADASGNKALDTTITKSFYNAALASGADIVKKQMAILLTCFDSNNGSNDVPKKENLARFALFYSLFEKFDATTPKVIEEIPKNYSGVDAVKADLVSLILLCFDFSGTSGDLVKKIEKELLKKDSGFLVKTLYDIFSKNPNAELSAIVGLEANDVLTKKTIYNFFTIGIADIASVDLGNGPTKHSVEIKNIELTALRKAVVPFFLKPEWHKDFNSLTADDIKTEIDTLTTIDLVSFYHAQQTTEGLTLGDFVAKIVDLNTIIDDGGTTIENGIKTALQVIFDNANTKITINSQQIGVLSGAPADLLAAKQASLYEYLNSFATVMASARETILGVKTDVPGVVMSDFIQSITSWNQQTGLSVDNQINSLEDLFKNATVQNAQDANGLKNHHIENNRTILSQLLKQGIAVSALDDCKKNRFFVGDGTADKDQDNIDASEKFMIGLKYQIVVQYLKTNGLILDTADDTAVLKYLQDTSNDMLTDLQKFCNNEDSDTTFFNAGSAPIEPKQIFDKFKELKEEKDQIAKYLNLYNAFYKECDAINTAITQSITGQSGVATPTLAQTTGVDFQAALKDKDAATRETEFQKIVDENVKQLWKYYDGVKGGLRSKESSIATADLADKLTYLDILGKPTKYSDQIAADVQTLTTVLSKTPATIAVSPTITTNTKKVEITKDAEKIKSTMDTIITIYALNDKFSAKKAEQKAIYNLLLANDYMTNPTNINNFFKTYIIKNNDSNEERLTFNESMGLLSFSIKDANNITIDLEKFKAIDQAFQDTTRKIESGEGAVRGSQGDKYTYSPKELLISILIHFVDDSSTIGLGADKASSQLIAFNFLNAMDSDKILDIYDQIYKNYYNDVNNTELFQNTVLKDFAMVADLDKTIINIAAGNDNGGAAHEFDYITKDNAIGTQHLKVMPDHFNKVFVDYIYPYMVKQAVTQNKTMMKDFTGENINKIPINYLSSGDISSEITQMEELKTMRLVDFAAFVNGLTETTARGELLQKIENIKKEIPEKADFAKNDYLAEEIDSFISFLEPDKKTEFIEQKDVIDGLTLTKIDSTDFGAITTADALTKAIETINKGLDAPDQIKSLFDLCKKTTTNNMITCNVGSTTIASTTKQTNLAHLNAVLGTTELTLEHVGWFLFKQELQIEGLIKQDADNDDIKNLINDIGDANLRKDIKTLLTTDIVNNKPNFTSQLTVDYKGTKLDLTQISWNPLISALRFHIPTIAEKEKIIEEYVNDYTKALAKLKELHNIPELKILENAPIWGATTTAGDFEVSLQALMYNKDFNTVVSTTAKTENDKLVGTYAIGDYQAVLASFKLTEQSKKDAFNLSKQTFASLLVEQNKYAEKIKEYIETGWENLFHPDRLNITEEAKKKKFHDLVDDFADTNKIAGAFDLLFTQLGMTDELTTLKTFLGTDGKKVAILKGFLQGAFKDGGSADIGYADQDAIMNTILATKFKYDNLSEEALSVYLQNAILEKQKTQIKNTSVFGDVKINSLNVNYQAFTELFAARKTLNDTKNVVNLADFINKLNEAIKTNHYTNGDNFTQFKDLFQKICTIGEKMNTEITSSGDAFVATVLDPTTIGDFNGVFREETLEAYLEDGLAAPTITNITQTKSALGSLQEAEIKNKIEAKIEPIVTFFGTEAKLETIQKKLNGKIKDQFLAVADVKNIFDVGQSYTTFQTEIAPLINNVDDTHLNKALEIMQTDLQQALEGCFNKTEASILTTELVEGYNQTAGGGTITVARQEAIKSTPAKLTKLSGLNFNPQFQAVAKILDVKDTTAGSIAYYEDLFSKIETIKTSITNLKNNDTIKAIGINQKVFTFNDATLDVAIVNANTVNSLSIDELVSKLELKNTGISQKIQDLKTASDSFINKLIGSETAQQNTALQQQINQLKGEKQILEDQKSHLSTGKNTLQQELNDKIAAYDALARENNVLESVRKKFVEEVFGSANDNADYKALSQGLKDALVDNVKNLLLAKYEAEKTKYETEKSLRETAENKKAQAESDKNNTVSEHNKTKEKLKKLTESATELSTFMGLSNPPEDRAAAQTTIKQEKQKMDKIIPNKANFSEFITDLTTLNGQLEQQTKKGTLDANIKAALTKMDDSAVVKQNQELEKEKQDLQVIIGDKDTKIADLETKVKTAEDAKTAAENNNSGSETDSKKKFTTKEVIVAGMVLTVCASVGGKFAGDAILNTTSSNKKGHKKSNSENLTNPKKIEDTNPKNEDI